MFFKFIFSSERMKAIKAIVIVVLVVILVNDLEVLYNVVSKLTKFFLLHLNNHLMITLYSHHHLFEIFHNYD